MTKNNPGPYNCYEKALPDEPMFTLLARDPIAPIIVELWAAIREQQVGDIEKIKEARKCANEMRAWGL